MKEIIPIKNLNDLSSIQPIYLNCILMGNNEIIFCGKSLGFIDSVDLQKWGFIDKEQQ